MPDAFLTYSGCEKNAPLSVIVCGVQGSGKSHTVSTMLENMFIPKDLRIGSLSKSLSGLVLHMSDGGADSIPSEAAWLGASTNSSVKVPKVVVYVSPSSLNTMTKVYESLGSGVTVRPLYFTEEELDAQAFLSMMSVGTSEGAPLYVQIILVSSVFLLFYAIRVYSKDVLTKREGISTLRRKRD